MKFHKLLYFILNSEDKIRLSSVIVYRKISEKINISKSIDVLQKSVSCNQIN